MTDESDAESPKEKTAASPILRKGRRSVETRSAGVGTVGRVLGAASQVLELQMLPATPVLALSAR